MGPVERLHEIARSFGPKVARAKSRLLDEIAAAGDLTRRELRLLGEAVEFLQAYPDNPGVLRRARNLVTRLPQTNNVHPYSYEVVRRLARLLPGNLEIEWDAIEDDEPLIEALYLLVTPGEAQGLEDTRLLLQEWFAESKPAGAQTDLEFLLGLLERSSLPPSVRVFVFENSQLPVRYRGPGSAGIGLPVRRIHYQRRDFDRSTFALSTVIRRPLERVTRRGQRVIDVALQALCARKLEIFPLVYANPWDVTLVDCRRGLQVALIGVRPEWRSAFESLYVFLVLKNGVPIAYGPASALLGCCEMGMNLFPEFRGGEIRYIYAQFMRVLHHRLGVDYFFLTRYGMGEGNEEALRSGAFWFYRKLGFKPTNPAVEELARAEESRMADEPGYRSDARMLRRLSRTEAYLDVSGGTRRLLDVGRLGMAQSRFIGERFQGNRALAEKRCAARIARLIGIENDGGALRTLAPVLCMIPDLAGWSRKDKSALARIIRAKDAPSEARAARLSANHHRLIEALHQLTFRAQ
jgi:hypothetical protein